MTGISHLLKLLGLWVKLLGLIILLGKLRVHLRTVLSLVVELATILLVRDILLRDKIILKWQLPIHINHLFSSGNSLVKLITKLLIWILRVINIIVIIVHL